jgi:hypothetical protein
VRNVTLLRHHVLATPVEERKARKGDWLFVAGLILLLLAFLVGSVTIAWFIIASLAHMISATRA